MAFNDKPEDALVPLVVYVIAPGHDVNGIDVTLYAKPSVGDRISIKSSKKIWKVDAVQINASNELNPVGVLVSPSEDID